MTPGPKPSANSKRNDPSWKPATLFIREDMRDGIQKLLALQSLTKTSGPKDQSEIIDAALRAFLGAELDRLELLYRKG
jgi:hypothetical protein